MSFVVSLEPETYRADGLDGFTVTSEYTPGNARAMIWLSQLAYEIDDAEKVKGILEKFRLEKRELGSNELISGLIRRKARFIVAGGHQATFVMFAGTDPLQPQDLITDFELRPALNVFHEGFVKAVDAVQPQVEAAIRRRGAAEQPIFFTGHSMGGALALISAVRALEAGFRATAVYTFGGPRVGGQRFFDSYTRDLGNRTFRLVHGDDIVAKVPPGVLNNFRHVGRLLHCLAGSSFEGEPSPSISDNEPDLSLASIPAALDILRSIPGIVENLREIDLDPRNFDKLKALPVELRDHVPSGYFRSLGVTL
jgi:triacylglycerol lipase